MLIFVLRLFGLVVLTVCTGLGSPPFSGTIFLDPDILTEASCVYDNLRKGRDIPESQIKALPSDRMHAVSRVTD